MALQADTGIPAVISPIALPRQASPRYDVKPFFSTTVTANASLYSAAAIANDSSGPPAVAQQSTVSNQHSSSSTATSATTALLASFRYQPAAGLQPDAAGQPSDAQQQSGQEAQASATSRRCAMSCLLQFKLLLLIILHDMLSDRLYVTLNVMHTAVWPGSVGIGFF